MAGTSAGYSSSTDRSRPGAAGSAARSRARDEKAGANGGHDGHDSAAPPEARGRRGARRTLAVQPDHGRTGHQAEVAAGSDRSHRRRLALPAATTGGGHEQRPAHRDPAGREHQARGRRGRRRGRW